MELVLTFVNTSHSVKAEQALLAGGVETVVMPLPSAIRAGCGLCLQISSGNLARADALLAQAEVPVEGRYFRADGKYLSDEEGRGE